MNPADRKKMCSSCDGMIPLDSEQCPYCSAENADLASVQAPQPAPLFKQQTLQESLASLYTPPYNVRSPAVSEPARAPSAGVKKTSEPVQAQVRHDPHTIAIPPMHAQAEAEEEDPAQGATFWSVFLLSLGAILLNLGLMQLFFSDHGVLRLEWKSAYWFVYCLAALPLFYFGLKKVNTLR